MGSTGRTSIFNKTKQGSTDTDTFGIKGAVVYKGKIPDGKGLEKQASNKITLKMPALDGNNILFQFKLSKDNKLMTIIGFKDGVPEVKCKVAVDSGAPSLDRVIAKGGKDANQAVKMKDLMHKSEDMNEGKLPAIANSLLKKKKTKEGVE